MSICCKMPAPEEPMAAGPKPVHGLQDTSRFGQELTFRLEPVCERNLNDLRNMNRVLFPLNYSDKVYSDILTCGEVSQLAYTSSGDLMGAIACRLENTLEGPILYILTLGVLAPYRGQGLGARLLHTVLDLVSQQLPEVWQAQLHVQVGNTAAMDLYSRAGFVDQGIVPMYYPRLPVKDAVFLTKKLQ